MGTPSVLKQLRESRAASPRSWRVPIGTRLNVFWKGDETWYEGVCVGYERSKPSEEPASHYWAHKVEYEGGQVIHDLSTTDHEILLEKENALLEKASLTVAARWCAKEEAAHQATSPLVSRRASARWGRRGLRTVAVESSAGGLKSTCQIKRI